MGRLSESRHLLDVAGISPTLHDRLRLSMAGFQWQRLNSPRRRSAESYIAGRFRSTYGAQIDHYLPHILTMTCAGRISGAVGVRIADDQPLFLEQYLDGPAHEYLTALLGRSISRVGLVEVGNLVSTRRGSSYLLFAILNEVLYHADLKWMVFTATRQVHQMFSRMGGQAKVLGEANPQRLADGGRSWGSYYEHQPLVMALDLAEAHAEIQRNPLLRAMVNPYHDMQVELGDELREMLT